MARFGSPALIGALQGSLNKRYVADVSLDGVRAMKDVPIINPVFNDTSTSLVQGTGSCTIIYQDDFGVSVGPQNIGDLFSPFGTLVTISAIITVGPGLTERVQMGVYEIAETPSIIVKRFVMQGTVLSKGDQIDLTLSDRFAGIQRDRFAVPGSPPDLSSVWKEYQRLAGLTMTRTVADGPITAAVAYQQDKLQACYDLATVLDSTACMLPDGTASMRPIIWPSAVDTLTWGETLVDAAWGMANDLVYNQVIVTSYDTSSGASILATSEITSGPLRTQNPDGSLSPYRRVPYFSSSQYITTAAQAQAYADAQLPRVSQLRSVSVVLTETFNPLRDLGDVLNVEELGRTYTARVTSIARTGAATQQTTVAVGQ